MQLFYSPEADSHQFLDEQESAHAVKVLRLKVGDPISIVDGKGNFYKALITSAHPKKCGFEILEVIEQSDKRDFYIHIAIAPTKNNDRIEWFVEKSVEFGIDEISFIKCERSERKQINLERITKVAVSAMKQSVKATIPKINDLVAFKKTVEGKFDGQCFIAHLVEGEKKNLFNAASKQNTYFVLIGPEGDFTPQEVELALGKGFQPVSLGNSRLRTETAGIAACQTLHILNS